MTPRCHLLARVTAQGILAYYDDMNDKIGLIAMSAKPYHVGHASLIELAAKECAIVYVYVSLSDRIKKGEFPVKGVVMGNLWKHTIEGSLPSNVSVFRSKASPIRDIWESVGQASEENSSRTYVLYGDPTDLSVNFPDDRLEKYCKFLFDQKRVSRRAVDRKETVDISGTKMREFLAAGDKASFFKHLPGNVDREFFWSELTR